MLEYNVKMQDPRSHYFEVSIKAQTNEGSRGNGKTRFGMPVWTPGSYLVREFSRNVLVFSAFDAKTGKSLVSSKTSKNLWEVDSAGSDHVVVKYQVYAFEFTVDTSYLDDQYALINGTSVFMYLEGRENEEIALTLYPPSKWRVISTSLESNASAEASESTGARFFAKNYDSLVDSPIRIGNQTERSFSAAGVKHTVAISTKRKFDEAAFVNDLEKIVNSTIKIFSHVPYERYVFLSDFVAEGGFGGLEHLNSTYCIAPLYRLSPPQEYKQLLSLFSHEFFHAWNVKRMRPIGLGPFDYSKETYTKSLWIAEGVTSYYDDLILRRAGIYSVGEYLEAFCNNIDLMKSLPGGKWQSAEEASFDAWIKHYRQNENSSNVLSSYYIQGALIGWMLDMEVRSATDCSMNLDDIVRRLYEDTFLKDGRAYSESEFESKFKEIVGGSSFSDIFESRVRGRAEINFEKYLEYAGLKLVPRKQQSPGQKEQGFLGLKTHQDGGKLIISNVLSSSPAEKAGLAPGDEIIAFDGLRMDSARLSYYASNSAPGVNTRIIASRLGSLLETSAVLSLKPAMEQRIVKLDSATGEEKRLFSSWLGASWNEEIRYEEYARSPGRKLVVDYL